MPAKTEPLSSALADRYKILRHLGEVGMAIVYLPEDLKHHRKSLSKYCVLNSLQYLGRNVSFKKSRRLPTCNTPIFFHYLIAGRLEVLSSRF
jgi:hypothetical protein